MYNTGNRDHWAKKTKEKDNWINLVGHKSLGQLPEKPLSKYKLRLTRYSSNEPDYDGLVSGFKHIVDGLRKHLIVEDDKLSNTGVWDCHWIKTKPKDGHVKIEVTG